MLTILGSQIKELPIFEDHRGSFGRLFDDREFDNGQNKFFTQVVNINHSVNKKSGTIRGLHMQSDPHSEGKIITCIKGAIIDLFVDMRRASKTYGVINSIKLNSTKRQALLVPRGCLHAFLTIEDNSEVIYATDNYYEPSSEVSVSPFSDELEDYWNNYPILVCSDKDKNAPQLKDLLKAFNG